MKRPNELVKACAKVERRSLDFGKKIN